MVRIDEDDLVVLVRPVLPDPVRVEDLHVRIVLGGRLRLPFRGNAQLRFRSLWGFVGHGPTPWIYGFARRYISRPGSSKAPCEWGETIKPFPPRGGPLSRRRTFGSL